MFEHIVNPQIVLPKLKRKNENGHRVYYDEEDNRYHSTTTVVGSIDEKGLNEWKARVGEDVAKYVSIRATTLGTKMHNMIENYLGNEKNIETSIFAKAHFNNIKPLLDKIQHINGLETKICSKELGLAGTADCIAEYDGIHSIIDFKTSSKLKKEEWIKKYFLQTTAYSLMWEELTSTKIDQIVILISGEDGSREEYIRQRDDYVDELKEVIANYKEQ